MQTADLVPLNLKGVHHFHIDHNASCLRPPPPPPPPPSRQPGKKILHSHCFPSVILGITVVPKEIEDNGYACEPLGGKKGSL